MIDDIFYRYKHKKRYQQKQINKRLVSNGFRPKYKV